METLTANLKSGFLTLFICSFIFSYAGNNKKEIKYEKKYKNSYSYFIDTYGTNDTTIALIDLYFEKRNNSANAQISMFVLSGALIPVFPPLGIATMSISSPLFINGIIIKNKYSNKQLTKSLEKLAANSPLRKRLQKKLNNKLLYNQFEIEEQLIDLQENKIEIDLK
ncbi:MAG: hypothetical protein Kow0079_00290 [Vicingaceae bacterium]